MQFNPNDLVEFIQVPKGDYAFVVANASEAISKKSGNHMIELELQVDVGGEKPLTVYDRLVNTPKALWVIKDFCAAVSPAINFEAGELLPANIIGAAGKAHLVLGEENPKGKRYMEVEHYVIPDKNPVSTGSTVESGTDRINAPAPSDSESDDIPF